MKVIYINIFVFIQCVYVYGIDKNINLTIKKRQNMSDTGEKTSGKS